MNFRNRILASKPFAIALFTVACSIVAIVIVFSVILVRNTYLTMRLSTICPDYFSYEYAYVVDNNGKGIDSVAVELWDNSNFNMIYRTFTDSNGRFVLFHDFGSFALYHIPFSYDLFVAVQGWNDTIRYSFERYRTCHFRKKAGPDTIICDFHKRNNLVLYVEQPAEYIIDSGYGFIPYESVSLSTRIPDGTKKLSFDKTLYTTIPACGTSIPFAVVSITNYRVIHTSRTILTEGTYYIIDRDGDRDLADEDLRLFAGPGEQNTERITDCTVRTCHAIDSAMVGTTRYLFDLRLRGLNSTDPHLRFRRADALKGTVTIDSLPYTIFVWDYRGSSYRDLSAVLFGIDRNRDEILDSREGSQELYEHAMGRIAFDNLSVLIDTIIPGGPSILCGKIKRGTNQPSEAMNGTWARDFCAPASCPVSLYQECSANRFVILYFFEGSAPACMEAADITTLVLLMRSDLGPTRIIGINRHSTGNIYSKEPVVNENLGWQGPLVQQFHNHLAKEIVCLDSTATIVYRGPVTSNAITTLWKHAGVDDATGIALFENLHADRTVERP